MPLPLGTGGWGLRPERPLSRLSWNGFSDTMLLPPAAVGPATRWEGRRRALSARRRRKKARTRPAPMAFLKTQRPGTNRDILRCRLNSFSRVPACIGSACATPAWLARARACRDNQNERRCNNVTIRKRWYPLFALLALLAGCGGGGGGGSTPAPTTVTWDDSSWDDSNWE